jgi:hypothetical protein
VRDSIVIAGSLAQQPTKGGMIWVFLQYILGFRRLGWDVLFLDRLEPEMCVDATGAPCSVDESVNFRCLRDVMEAVGLGDSYSLFYDGGARVIGRSRRDVLEHTARSAYLLNVMGFFVDEEVLGHAPRRVFLDIDPGFGQMWHALGLADVFRGHDLFVTVGENIGQADCEIPTCGLTWIPTPQPVVLSWWPVSTTRGAAFTSVGAWRGPYAPVEYQGRRYGLRAHEFRKFVRLPQITGRAFEIALDIHSADANDIDLLSRNGWHLVDPLSVAGDPWRYRDYIQGSAAELLVAKSMYVEARSGWFSDRSLCYLASGRPVLAQDTGFGERYPLGEGLLAFRTLEEAAAGTERITRDYALHARAARGLAEEFFDSDKVLGTLLDRLGAAAGAGVAVPSISGGSA